MKWIQNIRQWSTEKITQRLLYVLIGLIVVVFAAFYLIGYNVQSMQDPSFNAPLLTDLVIILMWILFLGAVLTTVTLAIIGYKKHKGSNQTSWGIPARRISLSVTFGTAIILIIGFLSASSEPMLINGTNYSETLWLKVSDMFILTATILLIGAIASAIFGATRYYRNTNDKKDVIS